MEDQSQGNRSPSKEAASSRCPDFDQKKNKEWQIFDPEAAGRPPGGPGPGGRFLTRRPPGGPCLGARAWDSDVKIESW